MPIAFDPNVPATWQTRLTNAYAAMPGLIQQCVQRMTPGSIDWALYKRWFDPQGNTNPANVQFVRNVFTTLSQWRQSKTLRFFNATGNAIEQSSPGVCAYVWLLSSDTNPGVAHVGSGVRIAVTAGMVSPTWITNDMAAILFHEISHKVGLQCGRNILDNNPPYGRTACLAKATGGNPIQALTNADNYRCYIKEANGIPWKGDF
jgi:lysine-specific metallo-endopeptidase family protein